jgi:RNA polymerase sigma factor (sigma-70 family)
MSRFQYIKVEETVVRALQGGERAALEKVYVQLSSFVYSLALRLLKDEQLAAEITQDTFIDVFEKASSLREPAAFVGWVKQIAVNLCFMQLRSPWHKRRVSIDSSTESGSGITEFEERDSHHHSERVDLVSDLQSALNSLPEQARVVVWLHDVEGYTHNEIGKFFGKSVSFSKTQLARAYARLAKIGEVDGSRKIPHSLAGSS